MTSTAAMAASATHLRPCDFACVRTSVYKQLAQNANGSELTDLFLTEHNLWYIFTQYTHRFQHETGFIIDPETHSLDIFSRLVFELIYDGQCQYENFDGRLSRIEQAEAVAKWTEDAIGALVFQALKDQRKKSNYLRRVRDPLYAKRGMDSLHIAKPFVSRRENSWRAHYADIGVHRYRFPVIDDA